MGYFILLGANYDEFKNFVKCSQLQPLTQAEVGELFQPTNSATKSKDLNKAARKQTSSLHHPLTADISTFEVQRKSNGSIGIHVPRNAGEFELRLKVEIPTKLHRSKYLLSGIEPKVAGKLFSKLEMSCELLELIIDSLYHVASNDFSSALDEEVVEHISNCNVDVKQKVYEWMYICSKSARFSINVTFLPKQQKGQVDFLLNIFLSGKGKESGRVIDEKLLKKLQCRFRIRQVK